MKKLLFLFLAMFMSLSVMASQSIQLSKENSVSLRDVVHSGSVSKVIQELAKKETNDESVIYLVLDTPGGSVFAGIDLINYLKAYKKPVHTITSFAASMGFQIAQGNQGKRLISPTGVLMSHNTLKLNYQPLKDTAKYSLGMNLSGPFIPFICNLFTSSTKIFLELLTIFFVILWLILLLDFLIVNCSGNIENIFFIDSFSSLLPIDIVISLFPIAPNN
jgi:hypothetical protein